MSTGAELPCWLDDGAGKGKHLRAIFVNRPPHTLSAQSPPRDTLYTGGEKPTLLFHSENDFRFAGCLPYPFLCQDPHPLFVAQVQSISNMQTDILNNSSDQFRMITV